MAQDLLVACQDNQRRLAMTGLQRAGRFTTDLERTARITDRLDYQQFFSDSNQSGAPIDDQALDRYQVTLEGIRKIDPDSYRMVLYSWA